MMEASGAKVSRIRIGELSKLSGVGTPIVSNHFKNLSDDMVTRQNNRIVGISPEAAEAFLRSVGFSYLYRPSIILSANLCGGVGKTTSIYNIGLSLRRVTDRKEPIVFIDGDPQASFTSSVFNSPASDNDATLLDYVQKKCKLENILTEVDDNIWFIKSNLDLYMFDKIYNTPTAIKDTILILYKALFDKFGANVKIFQDHTPMLSTLFQSSICALGQLDNKIMKSVLVPMRSDRFSVKGAEYVLIEIDQINQCYNFDKSFKVHCFFSNVDDRLSVTADAIKLAQEYRRVNDHFSPFCIKTCADISKSFMKTTNIFNLGHKCKAVEDYQDLLLYIYQSYPTQLR